MKPKPLKSRTLIQYPWSSYIPQEPTDRQEQFLYRMKQEGLYGGSAGGGKSSALLMAALQFEDVPGYAALILRKSYADLALPDAIMDRSHQWLRGTDAKWHETEKTWEFPSGSTLTFGYLQNENDKYRYQSSAFQCICFDELTQFSENQYTYLFSRLRKLKSVPVPLRMRSASNPGGVGHAWVKQRFMIERRADRFFIPARLEDNPHLNAVEYRRSLMNLDPYTREQLLNGNWNITKPGRKFNRGWFERNRVPIEPEGFRASRYRVRFWDLAATEAKPGKDPDWTAGALLSMHQGQFCICDVKRIRGTPKTVNDFIRATAERDGVAITIVIEQEGGASGAFALDHFMRHELVGYNVRPKRQRVDKETRANPVSSAAEAGNIYLVEGEWNRDLLDELELFPQPEAHDDQVDALSGAYEALAGMVRSREPLDVTIT